MAEETTETTKTTESPASAKWYADMSPSEDRVATYDRFNSREDFHNSFFEKQTKISNSIVPPTPGTEKYIDEVRAARAKLGGKLNADEYSVAVPDDLKEDESFLKYTESVRSQAAKYGITQEELDAEVVTSTENYRKTLTDRKTKENQDINAQNEKVRKFDEAASNIWGARKDQQLGNAAKMAKYYDDGLFSDLNAGLSPEVLAEQGGVLTQKLKHDIVLSRLMSVLHDTVLSEGNPPPGGRPTSGPSSNVYNTRYDHAKTQWPNRGHEVWDSFARGGK